MTMNGDVCIAFVTYGNSSLGKHRPVVIWNYQDRQVFFKVTSKFNNKSDKIRSRYFPIFDWYDIGLNKPSYIDCNSYISLNEASFQIEPFTRLTGKDIRRFDKYIKSIGLF